MNSVQIDCETPKQIEWRDLKSSLMRATQNDARRHVALVRLHPAGSTETPSVSRLEPFEAEFWPRRRKIVPFESRELEKLLSNLDADSV